MLARKLEKTYGVSMSHLMSRCKVVNLILVGVMLLEAAPLWALGDQDVPRIENVRVQTTGPMVYIYYDLIGPPQQVYNVTVTVRSRTDSTFQFSPLNLSGDVGTNVFSGVDWRIAWNYSKELSEGLKEDYYFVVSAKIYSDQIESTGLSTELWIAGGAAAAGVLALLIFKKKSETVIPPAGSFPSPPGRP